MNVNIKFSNLAIVEQRLILQHGKKKSVKFYF